MGPFGTYGGLDWGQRGIFWGVISASAVFFSTLVRSLRRRLWAEMDEMWREVLHVSMLTLCLAPLVYGLAVAFNIEVAISPSGHLKVFLFVALICALLSALRRINHNEELLTREAPKAVQQMSYDPLGMMGDVANNPGEPYVGGGDTTACRLMRRMPTGTDGPILHLAARDHFVDVELDGALVSLRMSFADAVAEMDGVAGVITHGAHWVAESAIISIIETDGDMIVQLRNGGKVPVSRYARAKMEASGLITRFATSA